ncbi:MAG: preprotein translocase subunit SecY [Bacilli bacterium]|jgi:preprotein translocase subunit SecY|nr:preprotein translocase subunit SecY [Bacillota bacterium]NLI51808.1 preprotein translocase subunit SecY [Erysipelotrichaceae bacterium]OQC49591.1 MAG: preprotein translocase subunit SecY [Tenericutes bacterium ADurb.Bin024]HOM31956.1 preprotein translocase subunit SecY [Bacilli bacterium]HOQ70759.1 preprotein translocase subunit SecY [Bacilli bacterium]
MKKIAAIFKNKEIVDRIFFTIMIMFVFRIGAAITVPGVTLSDFSFQNNDAFGLMNLLGGGTLQQFSVFALGVSPYITASIIVQLLSMDVLPALTDLANQGDYGRKKMEMTNRYLTLMLGAVQAYGVIVTMENQSYITLKESNFWTYAYIITVMLAGTMLVMWLGDQISSKGIGNGISMIIFAGIVSSLPQQIIRAYQNWLSDKVGQGSQQLFIGLLQFGVYVLSFLAIIGFITFIETSKRKIPVQHAGKSGQTRKMAQASFLPIKINSAGVIPVIFASSIMMAPSIIASFISGSNLDAEWLKIFNSSATVTMPWFNDKTWQMPWGLLIYLFLIVVFAFFYAKLQINPEKLAENFQKNGSYIPGVRPGAETERYVSKVLNRITVIGAFSLAVIAALPIILVLLKVVPDQSLALGGTGLIIVVGVAIEINNQIDGLLAGKSYEEGSVLGG